MRHPGNRNPLRRSRRMQKKIVRGFCIRQPAGTAVRTERGVTVLGMYRNLVLFFLAGALPAAIPDVVKTDAGRVKGSVSNGVAVFKGIPFAAPPVGALRWKAPQSVAHWKDVRAATEFGPRCMQGNIYSDMIFRDKGPSEDCLYLNVWTPAASAGARLPVMVWIYGGGFAAGATSEPRQDGENLARKGVVVVSMNTGSAFSASSRMPSWPRNPTATPPATTACSTSSPRSNGCTKTSRRSAAIRPRSPSSANPRDRFP